MFKINEKITKAYSGRVRSSLISGQNRTQGEYTDNYYQAVAGKAHAAVASPLLIHRFEGICTASGPMRLIDDHSSSPRRAIVLVAMLVAAKSMLVADGTVTRTVCQTVSAVLR
ncbi:hypothetical protein [Stenotrophomonas maltophilia]|uniref:hypothetical protein n=1 Tax=Stenotrophomonas maltophilia TaxID=40324 RepID=UPI0011B5FA35|nr:hypothetical protein [Stenotrophomonas maltophilia]